LIYITRPPIPVLFINQFISWRTPIVQEKYRQSNKTAFKLMIKDKLQMHDYVLMKNDYPYAVNAGVSHWLLWISNNITNVPYSYLYSSFPGKKIKAFENFYFMRSIPEYKHYHVFVW